MKTKKDKEYSFQHTKARLLERYDLGISRDHYDNLCDRIKNNRNAVVIEIEYQKNDTQYIYDLDFPYRNAIRVVWSEKRQCITTALPREGLG